MNSFVEFLRALGPLGAFIVAFIDGVGLPNPGGPDYLILFLGWKQPGTVYLSAGLSVLGALIGSMILFWVARKGGEKYLEAKAGPERSRKFRGWFRRYGLVTVFIPALIPFIPLPMKVFVLCSGVFSVHPAAFLAVMAAGKVPRYFGLAYLGKSLGKEGAELWIKDHRWHFAIGAVALFAALFLLVKISERWRSRHGDTLVPRHD